MKVHIAFRPEDQVILGVFSSEENASAYQKQCFGGGRDIEISEHIVDEELELDEKIEAGLDNG